MAEFHFLRPWWLLAFIPLGFFLCWLARRGRAGGAWEAICDPALLPHILAVGQGRPARASLFLLALAAALGIIALAGPAWERLPRPVFERQSALVIALDLSYSMYARDIQPSRLERARFKIADLLNLREEGHTALVVYAGAAFTVTPLTRDINTIKAQLTALSPEIMPAPGSDAGGAIDLAMTLMAQGGHGSGHILLVTDGIAPAAEGRFKAAGEKNYPVSILAMGTEAGAPINMPDGRPLEDRAGRIVIPRLNPRELRRLALLSGGGYEPGRIMDDDIQRLNALFNSGQARDNAGQMAADQWADQWHEAGAGLVLLILPLAALAFRRGYISLLACFILLRPDPAAALDWRDLWLNKDQQAMRALDDNAPEVAAGLFRDRDWRAAAEYRAGRYAEAAALLQDRTDPRGIYNKGNALARQGRPREAIAAYAEVLRQNPDHADAAHNKALLEALLERQRRNRPQADNGRRPDPARQTPQRPGFEPPSTDPAPEPRPGRNPPRRGQPEESSEGTYKAEAERAGPQPERPSGAKAGQAADGQPAPAPQAERQRRTDQARQGPPASAAPDEGQLAEAQWLRRIPDDPGGLLRRKFRYQYRQQAEKRQKPQNSGRGQYW